MAVSAGKSKTSASLEIVGSRRTVAQRFAWFLDFFFWGFTLIVLSLALYRHFNCKPLISASVNSFVSDFAKSKAFRNDSRHIFNSQEAFDALFLNATQTYSLTIKEIEVDGGAKVLVRFRTGEDLGFTVTPYNGLWSFFVCDYKVFVIAK